MTTITLVIKAMTMMVVMIPDDDDKRTKMPMTIANVLVAPVTKLLVITNG